MNLICEQTLNNINSYFCDFPDFENEIFCVNSSKFIALNFLFTTYQEGYLFYVSSDTFKVRFIKNLA